MHRVFSAECGRHRRDASDELRSGRRGRRPLSLGLYVLHNPNNNRVIKRFVSYLVNLVHHFEIIESKNTDF